MNHRKRPATDDLLPTSRPAKVARSNHLYLETAPQTAALVQPSGIITRWVNIAEDIMQLVVDTANVVTSPSITNFLTGFWSGLSRRILPKDQTEPPLSAIQPDQPQQPVPSQLPSPSPSIVSISPPPKRVPAPPPRRQPENAVASSSGQWLEPSKEKNQNTGLLTPSSSGSAASSLSTSFVGFDAHVSRHPQIAAALQRVQKKSLPSRRAQKYPHREHIFQRKYEKDVRDQQTKTREEMEYELFELRKKRGHSQDFNVFQGWLLYAQKLDMLDRISSLAPSPSLANLHEPPQTVALTRSQTITDTREAFLVHALDRAHKSLKSKPPQAFSPSLDRIRFEKQQKAKEVEDRLRPKKKPLPPSLPPKDDAEVEDLLHRRGIISKCAREQVSDKDLSRLRPHQWLNDEIINFYGQMILSRSEEGMSNKENKGGNATLLNVHYFSTFFWTKLVTDGYEKARLAKWTKKIDIFSKDIVLIPVNHNNAHWTGAAINFRQKRIESYDSMGTYRPNVYKVLRAYLDAESRNKKKKPFDFTGWEDYFLEDTPEQDNGYDCGVFTCQFLESLSRGEDGFAFRQANIPYLRRRMIWEIGHARLRDES